MKTNRNMFGELVTKWQSHKHPDNSNFMQIVNWRVTETREGKTFVSYNLGDPSKSVHIYNMTKEEAIDKFTD